MVIAEGQDADVVHRGLDFLRSAPGSSEYVPSAAHSEQCEMKAPSTPVCIDNFIDKPLVESLGTWDI